MQNVLNFYFKGLSEFKRRQVSATFDAFFTTAFKYSLNLMIILNFWSAIITFFLKMSLSVNSTVVSQNPPKLPITR